MNPNIRNGFLIFVATVVGMFVIIQRQKTLYSWRTGGPEEKWSDPKLAQMFPFVPANIQWCDVLFELSSEQHFPAIYNKIKPLFDREVRRASNLFTIPEGDISSVPNQALTYSRLSNLSFVNTVCETGFNEGNSALIWLASNPTSKVYSFDLGFHEYSKPMADYLQKTFPGRFNAIWGDSTKTVPEFVKNNPKVKCDLIVIDGGHAYDVAKADMLNMRPLANKEKHILLLDDHPCFNQEDVEKAWFEEINEKRAQEYWKCQFFYNKRKGFTVAKYINL